MGFRPIIYTSEQDVFGANVTGDAWKFGSLGEKQYVTFHHTAGPRATSKRRAQELHRAYHRAHKDKGWGWLAYHWLIDDEGRFYKGRPGGSKGAHVGGYNSRNVGIALHGNFDLHRPTWKQYRAIKWLFEGGFYRLTGEPEAGYSLVRGHREWPGHSSNACPGKYLMKHIAWRRSR